MENNVSIVSVAGTGSLTVQTSSIFNPAIIAVFCNMSLIRTRGFDIETYKESVKQRFMAALQNDAQFAESCGFTSDQLMDPSSVKFNYEFETVGSIPEWSKFVVGTMNEVAKGNAAQKTVLKLYNERLTAISTVNNDVFKEVVESVEAANFIDTILDREFSSGNEVDAPLPKGEVEFEIVNEEEVTIIETFIAEETVEVIDEVVETQEEEIVEIQEDVNISLSQEDLVGTATEVVVEENTLVIEEIEVVEEKATETIEEVQEEVVSQTVESIETETIQEEEVLTVVSETPVETPAIKVPQVPQVEVPTVTVIETLTIEVPQIEEPVTQEFFTEKLGHLMEPKALVPTEEQLNHAAKVSHKAAQKAAKIAAIERYQKAPQAKRQVYTHTREGLQFLPKQAIGQTLPCFPLGMLYISARQEAIREQKFKASGTKKEFVNNAGKMSIGSFSALFNGELMGANRHMSSFPENFEFRMASCELKSNGVTSFVTVPYIMLSKVIDKGHNGIHMSLSEKQETFQGVKPVVCHPFDMKTKSSLMSNPNFSFMGTFRTQEGKTVDVFFDKSAKVYDFANV